MIRNLLIGFICLSGSIHGFAQEKSIKGIRSMTYGGAGFFLPSSSMKENSMIGNGVNFSFGHFQSIGKAKVSMEKKRVMQWGVEARLMYSKFEKDLHPPLSIRTLKYDNGSGVPQNLSLQYETLKKNPDAFHYLVGPSLYMGWEQFFIHPSLMLGYASVSQEKFRFYSNVFPASDPAQDTTINFYRAGHETNNGFAIVPGFKAGYRLHKNLAAFLSVDYSLGSSQQFADEVYQPNQGSNPSGVYDYDELVNGSYVEYTREGKLRALLINLNLALTLNR